jgi:anti-sigma regulatory factor (Ser/Thr protein kinase)
MAEARRQVASAGRPAADPPAAPPAALEVRFPSSSEYLSLLRTQVRWFAKKCGFADRECGRIVLAAVEATTNIIRHAYAMDPGQWITLHLREIPGGLELEFLDRGHAVAPGEVCARQKSRLQPGGLGVDMMKHCMDHFSYEPRPEGGARLLLRKLRGSSCQEEATP